MHFGKNLTKLFFILGSLILCYSCKDSVKSVYLISPLEGARVTEGKSITLKTDAEPGDFDSIKYYVDSKLVTTRKDTQGVKLPTTGLPFGARLITATVFSGKDSSEITTNIQLLPSKAPVKYSYKVVNVFPHDTSSYTEGLEYPDGFLYESDGEYGQSSLRKADLKTGKVLQKIDIPARFFAEGITVIENKIILLTYKEGIGFEYDRKTFNKLKEFPYNSETGEGWGLCFDGRQIYNTDGSNNIYLLNKDTYQKERTIEVFDNNGSVNQLNELEYINGKLYANIYQQDRIVIIDPKTGGVEAELNLPDIAPYPDRAETGLVLNGIAWDSKGKRLFVTGKKWNKLFEIKIM